MKAQKLKRAITSVLSIAMIFTLIITHGHISAAGHQDTEALKLNKTATWNDDGTATIKLESYTTGKVTSTTTSVPTDIVLVLDVSGSMDDKISYKKTRLEALQDAANTFIEKTSDKNASITDASKQHRISIVKYAGELTNKVGNDTYGYNSYNYTQIVKQLTTVNDENEKTLKKTINSLTASGATSADYGLGKAQEALTNSSSDRHKVVIMFTDGEPNHQSGFDKYVARDAINAANKLKKISTIYTISVLNDADPNDKTSNQNKYMNAVSSNYPNATASVEGGYWRNRLVVDFGEGKNNGFYKTATNASELENVFNDISEDIGTSGIDLGKTAVLSDYISDYFKVPSANQVKTYTESYNGQGQWTKNNDTDKYDVDIHSTTRTVHVTGFDYSQNYVLENDPKTGKPTGQKLVVEITVAPIDGFIGGNQVVTNKEASGIYNQGELVKKFPKPNVDVPIQYHAMTNDASIYIGDQWSDVGSFIESLDQKKVQYKINGQNYVIDGTRNAYVDIVYTILDKNNQKIGSYTIQAGQPTGTLKLENIDTTQYTDCQDFKVKVTVTPRYQGTHKELSDNTLKSTLHVLKPAIELTDTKILFGETTDLHERLSLNQDWVCSHQNVPQPQSTPDMTYSFTPSADHGNISNQGIFTPDVIKSTDFTLTVKNHGTDITQFTKFHNSDKDKDENLFTVDVIGGKITIQKQLVDTDKIDLSDGDPIFVFKVTGDSIFGQKTYYKYVRYSELTELNKIKSVMIEGLPVGDYTVEELSSLRYAFNSVQFNKQSIVNNQGKIRFDINGNQLENTVDYTNKTKSDDYFSDNDVLVNRFVKEDGKVVIQQDQLKK